MESGVKQNKLFPNFTALTPYRMRYYVLILSVFVISLPIILTGCGDDEKTVKHPILDVYVAGVDNGDHKFAYWKNGVKFPITDGTVNGDVTDIALSGTDVYVSGYYFLAGTELEQAAYWKNTELAELGNGVDSTFAMAIAVNETQVYVAGYQATEEGMQAVYWEDDELHVLNSGGYQSRATSIALSGTDVYVAGTVYVLDEGEVFPRNQAAYWKNGTMNLLPDDLIASQSSGIAVENGDVYVSGFNIISDEDENLKRTTLYWKNGEKNLLITSSEENYFVETTAITVTDGKVYVSGYESPNDEESFTSGVYWLNSEKVQVTPDASDGMLFDIAVMKKVICTTGITQSWAWYWYNNRPTRLEGILPWPVAIAVAPME